MECKRPRVQRLLYKPVWEGVFKNYAIKKIVCGMGVWKFSRLGYSVDDLVQEAWIEFEYCRCNYRVFEAKHFMSLFQRSLHSRLYDLAMKASVERENIWINTNEQFQEDQGISTKESVDYNNGPLRILLKQAPKEVKEVLELIGRAPSDFLDDVFSLDRLSNQFLCKKLGYNPQKVNLIKLCKEYFKLV